ncbi:HlyD family secretion protein [Planctobacterium marinum]|uniref:Toxin secretion, membrane fusion protein n=1 Tax=Planctobacterium marinum TaxID=1631968 RepID=A0AA48HUK6_9ALTE|nr:toxin secretion, membrane fusion protein [Planctobacterium marinum]
MNLQTLFRKEALEHNHNRLNGSVVLNTPPSYNLLLTFFSVIAIASLLFIAIAQFKDQKTVTGYLVYDQAVVKIYPTSDAIIKTLLVNEGDAVSVGQPLAIIRRNSHRLDGSSNDEQLKQELEKQLASLQLSKSDAIEDIDLRTASLQKEAESLVAKIENLNQKITIIEQRIALSEATLASQKSLATVGGVSELDIAQSKAEYLRLQESHLEQLNTLLGLKNSQQQNEQQRKNLPLEKRKLLLDIDTEVSALTRSLLSMSDEIEYEVQARNAGIVSNIVAKEGEFVSNQFPLLTITPANSELLAELLVPSRAIAFIEEGQDVYIRFDAFPNQIYGDVEGQVSEISQSVLRPDEWSNPLNIAEPVYRVRASLAEQQMVGKGRAVPLKSGLRLQADIVMEQQTFLMYLLSPLLELKNSL